MWDTYRLSTWGNFSFRKIALSLLAAILSVLFVATAQTTPVNAESAVWDGDNIKVGEKVFKPEGGTFPGIGSEYNTYVYRENPQASTVQVIAIPRAAAEDKTKEIPGNIRDFQSEGGNMYSSPGPPSELKVAPNGQATTGTTSCAIQGVGWIICGPSRWIAGGMDLIYGWISDFLTVKPLADDTTNGMYQAWDIVRGIANACFLIAFLLIIYAQVSSYGISNYEIKKMVPKLVLAAILVNVSYYICAYAVDLSNILGNAVQNAFVEVREALRTSTQTGEGWDMTAFTFKNITEYVLSAGAVGGGTFLALTSFAGATVGGSISGLVFMLFPILIAGVLSVTVALIILAARQALITVLIVIAPLAFVAYLLPNTEKWFEKWRGLFTTMLMVFPMFSLLFGGSQLASYLILQNADQLTIVLLALFIQVAPLALTPFLLQFSGSLLGRIAGMVNNPQRGIIDRASNYAKDRAEVRAARGMEAAAKGGGHWFQRYALGRETSRMNRESWKKRGQEHVDAAWHNDERYAMHHDSLGEADLRKKAGEARANSHFQRRRSNDFGLQRYVATQRLNDDITKNLQGAEDAEWEEAKAKDMGPNNRFADKHTAAMREAQQAQVLAYRTGTAQAMQKIDYAKALTGAVDANADTATRDAAAALAQQLAVQAGGIDSGGADSARANALAALKKSKAESIAEGRALYQYYNLSSQDRQKLAKGISVEGIADNKTRRVFTAADSEYVQLAAVEDQVAQGTIEEALELIMLTGEGRELHAHREVIVDAMIKGGVPQKAAFLGGKALDDIRSGKMRNTSDLLKSAASQIAKGKLSAEVLLNQDKTSMEVFVDAVEQIATGQVSIDGDNAVALPGELDRLFASAHRAVYDPRINARLGERKGMMERLAQMGYDGTAYTPPRPPEPGSGQPGPDPDDPDPSYV